MAEVLGVPIGAVMAGDHPLTAFGEWPAALPTRGAGPGIGPVAPDGSTPRKLFTRTRRATGRRVIAVDGKALRRAQTPGPVMPDLAATLNHVFGTVVGQVAVDSKHNQ